jgi:hypothetical protein
MLHPLCGICGHNHVLADGAPAFVQLAGARLEDVLACCRYLGSALLIEQAARRRRGKITRRRKIADRALLARTERLESALHQLLHVVPGYGVDWGSTPEGAKTATARGAALEVLDMRRTAGDALCSRCGKPYRDHPDSHHRGRDDEPYLKIDCNGLLVKL